MQLFSVGEKQEKDHSMGWQVTPGDYFVLGQSVEAGDFIQINRPVAKPAVLRDGVIKNRILYESREKDDHALVHISAFAGTGANSHVEITTTEYDLVLFEGVGRKKYRPVKKDHPVVRLLFYGFHYYGGLLNGIDAVVELSPSDTWTLRILRCGDLGPPIEFMPVWALDGTTVTDRVPIQPWEEQHIRWTGKLFQQRFLGKSRNSLPADTIGGE